MKLLLRKCFFYPRRFVNKSCCSFPWILLCPIRLDFEVLYARILEHPTCYVQYRSRCDRTLDLEIFQATTAYREVQIGPAGVKRIRRAWLRARYNSPISERNPSPRSRFTRWYEHAPRARVLETSPWNAPQRKSVLLRVNPLPYDLNFYNHRQQSRSRLFLSEDITKGFTRLKYRVLIWKLLF